MRASQIRFHWGVIFEVSGEVQLRAGESLSRSFVRIENEAFIEDIGVPVRVSVKSFESHEKSATGSSGDSEFGGVLVSLQESEVISIVLMGSAALDGGEVLIGGSHWMGKFLELNMFDPIGFRIWRG